MDPVLKALAARDHRRLVRALRGLDEAQRRTLARSITPPEGTSGAYELALLGTATLGQIRRHGAWDLVLAPDDLAAAVLLDRRPSWLASFAAWYLRAETWEPTWPLVRTLVRAGAIERPEIGSYLDGLLATSRAHGWTAKRLLREDPGLVDDAWELLALGGGARDTLTAADAAGAHWAEALTAALPRARLLDALLSALAGDLVAYRTSWYTKLWRALGVRDDERAARVDALAALLGAAPAPVVGFAVEELGRAEPFPRDVDLGPALAAPAKKTVRAALRLLDRAGGPASAAVMALSHPGADIQGEVLDRLERWGLDDEAREALRDALAALAATQRPRAEALLDEGAGSDDTPGGRDAAATHRPRAEALLDERVSDSTTRGGETRRSPAGDALPEAIRTALNFGGPLPSAPVPGEPVLGEPVAPIASLDELAEAISRHLAEPYYVRDERIMDAVLRRCDQPFPTVLEPFAPMLRRINQNGYAGGVLHVAAAWLTGVPATRGSGTEIGRIVAACARAARGDAAPLLALPTHEGGWIAPAALVERVRAVGETADEAELAQALLRLAPEGRDPESARDLPGRPGAIVRCALGRPAVPDDGAAALAARAVRNPPLTEIRIEVEISGDEVRVRRTPGGPLSGPVGEYLARATGENGPNSRFASHPDAWPSRRDVLAAGVFWHMRFNLGRGAPTFRASALLETLAREGEPLPPLALRYALLALCSSAPEEHISAADLLIAAIANGSVDAPALAPPLRQDLPRVLTSRLGPRLMTVASAGPLQRAVIRDLLDAGISGLAALEPRTHGALLVPFDELCAQTGARVHHSRAFLETLTGSSKAAKAARSLLARDGDRPPEEHALALEARLRRAKRWAAREAAR